MALWFYVNHKTITRHPPIFNKKTATHLFIPKQELTLNYKVLFKWKKNKTI
jgi:hypothetical protein